MGSGTVGPPRSGSRRRRKRHLLRRPTVGGPVMAKNYGVLSTLYKKSLAQEEGYGACFSREGSAEVKSENRS